MCQQRAKRQEKNLGRIEACMQRLLNKYEASFKNALKFVVVVPTNIANMALSLRNSKGGVIICTFWILGTPNLQ